MPKAEAVEAAIALLKDDSSKLLTVTNDDKVEVKTGEYVPRAKAKLAPQISFPGATTTSTSADKKYIIVAIDLDAPFPSWPILGPILHWIQTDLTADPATGLLSVSGGSDIPSLVSYHPPGPPPGSSPHRYVFLLYDQPENFDGKTVATKPFSMSDRIRFDYKALLEKTGLGEVVATNWYLSN